MPDNTAAIQRLVAFGQKLKIERKKRQLSQMDVAKRCRVSNRTLSELETGQRTMPLTEDVLTRIVVAIEENSDRIKYWLKIVDIPFEQEKVEETKAYLDTTATEHRDVPQRINDIEAHLKNRDAIVEEVLAKIQQRHDLSNSKVVNHLRDEFNKRFVLIEESVASLLRRFDSLEEKK